MAATRLTDGHELFYEDTRTRCTYYKLGLLNGFLIGLGLAAGTWALDMVGLADVPVPLQYPSLILGILVLVAVNSLAGWLSSHFEKAGLVLFVWLGTAVLSTLTISYQPFYGRTLTVWLADGRFWGLPIYPDTFGSSILAPLVAGLFIILLLVILAVLQGYRLDGMYREMGENGRFLIPVWLLLLAPLPFTVVAGMVTSNIVGDPSARAVQLVHQAIQVGRTYEGDLFELGLQEGLNYSAIQGVRDQMSADYSLLVGDINPTIITTFVVAHFDNGAWINCRVVNDQLSFCSDAAPPYTIGLASLITGAEIPADCRGCLPRGGEAWSDWFQARRDKFDTAPQVSRLAQWGRYVLMRAESETGDFAIECWFNGISPVRLESCAEAGSQ